ncbi:MAG: ABC transporter ATP-binding protein [Clostridia bacterium]|nr:ABC transporter ATP-binding protein [Clostridia bacterium]MBQ7090794.1 ABC transporter ATP-binding protein [Clostridia bacterium]
MSSIRFIFSHMQKKGLYFTLLALPLIISLLLLLPSLLIGNLVDNVLYEKGSITVIEDLLGIKAGTGMISMLVRYIVGIVGITLLSTLARYFTRLAMMKIAIQTTKDIRLSLYEKLQTLSAGFYAHTPSGELIANLTSDVVLIQDMLWAYCYDWVRNIATLIFTLILLFYYNIELTLMLTAFMPIFALLSYIIFRYTRKLHRRLRDKFSDMNTYVNENLGAYRVVKAFAREDYENERLDHISGEYRDIAILNAKKRLRVSTPLHLVARLMSIFGLCIAAIYVIQGEMTVGMLTVFNTYVFNLQTPIRTITNLINITQQTLVSAHKVYDLYTTDPEVENSLHLRSQRGRIRTIEFRDVSLELGGHKILDNVSLKLEAGKTLAIMGPTGAGKTILISLLIRLYDPTDGYIYVNGIDIRDIDMQKLRKEIAIATQDVFLFSDTIDSNIAYSNPDMSEEMVRQMAETACAADFIEKLTDGYDTIIGERGIGLSGGQRQRIALARAVAKDSSVIILDDTTSAVDMETEVTILQELRKITNKSKIIVAQRVTSVMDADEIIILQEGAITERGTHEELLEKNGYYAEIYRISKQNEEVEVNG